ncbi:hydroxylysine kinase [Agrococcus sp. UYP10]|uniref:phosphotransferase n=1 Tax=Agrococcus sp. UYP10 TaxID=1756355 RepID=UPI003393529A
MDADPSAQARQHAVEELFRESGLLGEPHRVDEDRLRSVLREEYGVDGVLTRLDTEKDATFRLQGERELLVKVSQPDEPIDVVRCQVDAIAWIEQQDPGIPVQTVLQARDGLRWRPFIDHRGRASGVLRVHEFIPGTLLADAVPTPAQLRATGAMLGRVDVAMRGFSHPGETRAFVWDLARFSALEPLVDLEPDERRRALALAVFDRYREQVAPALADARTQVIHGDFSPYNAVVDPASDAYITGVLDFGDTMRTPVIFDPAVLLGNHLLPSPQHPWTQARALLDGYRAVLPLTEEEVRLVVIASVARVTLRALVANRRVAHDPERAAYVLHHARDDWRRVANAVHFGFDDAGDHLLHLSPHTTPTPH